MIPHNCCCHCIVDSKCYQPWLRGRGQCMQIDVAVVPPLRRLHIEPFDIYLDVITDHQGVKSRILYLVYLINIATTLFITQDEKLTLFIALTRMQLGIFFVFSRGKTKQAIENFSSLCVLLFSFVYGKRIRRI